MLMIHFKGELSDGHVHITAEEFCEHSVHERYEKDLAVLRKLAVPSGYSSWATFWKKGRSIYIEDIFY